MIERKDVMPVNFLEKENFCGSHTGMRYRMEKGSDGEEVVLTVTVWGEPYGYDATPEEEKTRKNFAFTENGILEGIEWLNSQQKRFKKKEREINP